MSTASPPSASASCSVDGVPFQQLVQDFVSHWTGISDYCEFQRLTAISSTISDDLNTNSKLYYEHTGYLQSYHDQSEAINYLSLSLHQVWFNSCVETLIEKQYGDKGSWGKDVVAGSAVAAVVGVLLLHNVKYSASLMRPLRMLMSNSSFIKRVVFIGGASILSGRRRMKSEIHQLTNDAYCTSPPLLVGYSTNQADPITSQTRLRGLYNDLGPTVIGAGGGYVLGHLASYGVKLVIPTWVGIFPRVGLAASRVAGLISPGLIAGSIIGWIATKYGIDKLTAMQAQRDHDERVRSITATATAIQHSVAQGDKYDLWIKQQILNNELKLDYYVLIRDYLLDLDDANEFAIRNYPEFMVRCQDVKERCQATAQTWFKKRIKEIIATRGAALAQIQELSSLVQSQVPVDPWTKTLLDNTRQYALSVSSFLDAEQVTESNWEEVTGTVQN
jgi:hypothetical protein